MGGPPPSREMVMTEKPSLLRELLLYMWLGTALFSIRAAEKSPFARALLLLSEFVIPIAMYVFIVLAFYDFEGGRFPEVILLIVCIIYFVIATGARLAIFLVLRYVTRVDAKLVGDPNRPLLGQSQLRVPGFIAATCGLAVAPIPLAILLGDFGAKDRFLFSLSTPLAIIGLMCLCLSMSALAFNLWLDRVVRSRISRS
jgi:hypothetical protein